MLASGRSAMPTGLPKSNVLYYEMTDGAWVLRQTVRNRAEESNFISA